MSIYSLGDLVCYDGEWYRVEKDYGNDVYLIGNEDSFVDLVPANHMSEPV